MCQELQPAVNQSTPCPPLAVAPASFTSLSRHAVSTGCHTGLVRRSWRHCYLCGRYHPLTVVGSVLTSQGFLEPSTSYSSASASAQVLFVQSRYGPAILQGARCMLLIFSAVTSSCRTSAGASLALRQYFSALESSKLPFALCGIYHQTVPAFSLQNTTLSPVYDRLTLASTSRLPLLAACIYSAPANITPHHLHYLRGP